MEMRALANGIRRFLIARNKRPAEGRIKGRDVRDGRCVVIMWNSNTFRDVHGEHRSLHGNINTLTWFHFPHLAQETQ